MNEIMEIIKDTKKLTLLYVEDNKDTVESSLLVFNDFFNNTLVADNGLEGVEKFKNNNVDIIITDINMPIMNGLKMIEEIRKLNDQIPIIVTSAYNESNYFQEAIKLSVDAYMLKPIDLTEFISVLKKIIQYINFKNENLKYINLLEQYQEAVDQIASISKTDPDGVITYINDSYSRVSGYSKEELIGKNHNVVRHAGNNPRFYEEMWDTIKNKKQIWKGIVKNISKSGKNYYAKTVIKPIVDNNNEVIEYIALRDNITNLMDHKVQIHDLITVSEFPIVILIKIELFEDMEIYYGQNLVGEIEKKFVDKIFNILPSEFGFDRVFILGNGIFALANDIKNLNIELNEFILKFKIFQKVLDKSYINYQGIEYSLNSIISIGYDKNAFENAKYGLKILKEKKQIFIISNNLVKQEQKKAYEHLEILKTIKYAIKNLKVISYFQPIINNKTMEIDKYESLVRIVDENDNILMPLDFLDIAKKTNYYSKITLIILQNSFKALIYTKKEISVNISFFDIENNETRRNILNILNENKEFCSKITFELLEEDDINDFKLIKDFIKEVKQYGIKIAIDDFGKGYSNFERLIKYQPDILKLDGLLIKNIEHDDFSFSIVEMLVTFAQKQNIKVIAEYVENENIFNILKNLGVDYSQGFYFGKAEPLKL